MHVTNPPVELTDRLWMLGTSAYPLYLFRGTRGGTLFEGGIGAIGKVLRDQLPAMGISGEFVQQVVVTHAHPDHVMAVPLFREMFPRVTVLASTVAAKTLSAEKAVSFFCKLDDALTGSLIQTGALREEHRRAPLAQNVIAIDRTLQDGDTIPVDEGVCFQVLETPGHSACSLSFWEPQRALLIISDATGYYLPDGQTWWPNYFADYGAYVRSIERLAGLGAEVLCLSHNAAIVGKVDVADYFRCALDVTKAYHQRICDEARSGQSVRDISGRLGAESHAATPLLPLQFFEKNCQLLVQQSLSHAGISFEK